MKYNAAGNLHFVAVNDFVTINGKDYIEISGTSAWDPVATSRTRDTWLFKDGKVYVELKDVVGIRQFSLEE